MRVVKAAAVQLSPVLYSREGTVERIVRKIHELGQQRVQFATFPETVVPYYPYFSFVQSPLQNIVGAEQRKLLDQAVTVPSAATDALGAAARQAGVVVSIGINERDGGTLYNTQLLFDADGTLIQRRRKISPTYHERMIWGQGDGSGLRAVDSHVGRIGQLACWEHYNPLARYAMMADGEQIHSAMYPGSIFGDLFSEQTQVNIRQHALESGCFVVCATAWLNPDQQAQIMKDTGCTIGPISGGCFTAIVAPDGSLMGEPIRSGESVVIADLDFTADRQAQTIDGLARPLQPSGAAQSDDRPNSGCSPARSRCATRLGGCALVCRWFANARNPRPEVDHCLVQTIRRGRAKAYRNGRSSRHKRVSRRHCLGNQRGGVGEGGSRGDRILGPDGVRPLRCRRGFA